jgi:hypothetical protein
MLKTATTQPCGETCERLRCRDVESSRLRFQAFRRAVKAGVASFARNACQAKLHWAQAGYRYQHHAPES